MENKDYILAEATPSKLWATGMSPFVAEHTAPKFCHGKKLLRSMLTAMAQQLTSPSAMDTPMSQSQGGSLGIPHAQSSETSEPAEPFQPKKNLSETPIGHNDANTADTHNRVGPLNEPTSCEPCKTI